MMLRYAQNKVTGYRLQFIEKVAFSLQPTTYNLQPVATGGSVS